MSNENHSTTIPMKKMSPGEAEDFLNETGDENQERGNWSNKLDFILSCTGYAVGLGNVWRFPYLCYKNGGGAFLIPYLIMLAFTGLPIFFLEVSIGQYSSQGPITCWRSVPLLRGIGYGMVMVSIYVGVYYNVIIMYAIYYIFASFTKVLPWAGCRHEWNTDYCNEVFDECISSQGIMNFSNACVNLTSLSDLDLDLYNITEENGVFDISNYSDPFAESRRRASEEYWKFHVLRESESLGDFGSIDWRLALCLMLAWTIVFFCLIRGVKSSGKVVYFTATFPYLVLFILLIRGLTLPGSTDGILFFITPRWEKLADPTVWLDAASQIFFSLSVAWGGLITLSSYNRFHNNCYFDAILIPIINCSTSIFAGFVIFSILGFMAHESNRKVEDVADQGFGLAFIAYPEVVASLPGAPAWSILFFVMLLTLGLDTQFTILETICTALSDHFPKQLRDRKTYVMLATSICGFLLGLTCITEAGPWWVSLLDSYGAGFVLVIFGLLECVAIGWIYGFKRFTSDIATMIGDKHVDTNIFKVWHLFWVIITPFMLAFVLLFNWINWKEPTYSEMPFPAWGVAIGWLIVSSIILWVPAIWIFEIATSKGTFQERVLQMLQPAPKWGPALHKHRLEADEVHRNRGTSMGGIITQRHAINDDFVVTEEQKVPLQDA
ncbi:sodium- and chloride-dependent glycine transporter 2-like [Antedon mediterranea]|uniref:sodium- and chloride-dependent glycine transporter 2-like n=1 Tax=Antedon mediterranea TaxID=105859 RepID=UPI003AF4505E